MGGIILERHVRIRNYKVSLRVDGSARLIQIVLKQIRTSPIHSSRAF